MSNGKHYDVVDFLNPSEIKQVKINELTKRQKSTVKRIGRWANGSCTHSKANKTNEQLRLMGLLVYADDAVVLTELGRSIYNELTA